MTQLAGTSNAPLEDLCERFGAVCESAVDPLEIASALEFDGFSDRTARAEYGVEDVFALARELYALVPRQPYAMPEPAAEAAPHTLVHGLLYALPAACFPAAAALLAGPGVIPALITALLTAWGLGQGLACIGYLRLGAAGPDQARRVLTAGLAAGLVVVVVVMTVTWHVVHAHPTVVVFGVGEGAYMLGASVLLVTGREAWLPVALSPGITGSVMFLLTGRPPALEPLTWAALAATPILACLIAVLPRTGPEARAGRLVIPAELRAAVPVALLGVISAGLLSFPVVAGPSGHGGVNTGALIASVPLALSMGAAEWTMLRYRRRTRQLLRATGDSLWFRTRARLLLLAAVGLYLSAAVLLTWLAISVARWSGQVLVDGAVLASVTAYLLLGTALFLVLMLQAARVRAVPIGACAVVLVTEVALRQHGLAVQVVAPAVLLAAIGGYALACFGAAVRHS